MFSIGKWVDQQGTAILRQPLSREVGGNQEDYQRTEGLRKLGWRVLQRKAYLKFTSQQACLRQQIEPGWKRGLWIYLRTAQIGDSLMDLAARSLLAERSCQIDLLTNRTLSDLYKGDPYFGLVTDDVTALCPADYDFVIVQSVHHRALRDKVKYFKTHPWLCIQGYYDVPDFCRGMWGAQRLMDLLEIPHDSKMLARHSIQKLSISTVPIDAPMQRHELAVVMGGIDRGRTYNYWPEVLRKLSSDGVHRCLLLGTGEIARNCAEKIMHDPNITMKFTNAVDVWSVQESLQAMKESKLLLAADGGAMHLAVCAGTEVIISLFTKGISPSWRLPEQHVCNAIISSTGDVSDINFERICGDVLSVFNRQNGNRDG